MSTPNDNQTDASQTDVSQAVICLWNIATMYFSINEYDGSVLSFGWENQGRTSKENAGNWNASSYIINKVKHVYQSYLAFWNNFFSFFSSNKNLSRQLFKTTHEVYALLAIMVLIMSLFAESGIDMIVTMLTPWILIVSTHLGRDFAANKKLMAYSWLLARSVSRQQYNMQLVWVLISHYIFVYLFSVSLIALGGAASPDSIYFGLSSTDLAMALGAACVFQICLTLEGTMRIKSQSDVRLMYIFTFLAVLGISMFLISISVFWLPILLALGGGCVLYSLNRWQAYDLQME
jgi:hypothetical protein